MKTTKQINKEIEAIVKVSSRIYNNGWAEANAGNLSIRIDHINHNFSNSNKYKLPAKFPLLNNKYFLITGTKKRLRDISENPEKNIALIRIANNGTYYECIWGTNPPTSELPAHLMVHEMAVKKRPNMHAVIHTHPTHLIAMSHMKHFSSPKKFAYALESMHPEVKVFIPKGVALLSYLIPGSVELGKHTQLKLQTHDIVMWTMHGIVCIGEDMEKAYDIVEIAEKSARIYCVSSICGRPPKGLSKNQIKKTIKAIMK